MHLAEDDIISIMEAYNHATDKQDMNQRVNRYLLERVREQQLEPIEAVQQSFFKPDMVEKLRSAGYRKDVDKIDLSQLVEETPEVIIRD